LAGRDAGTVSVSLGEHGIDQVLGSIAGVLGDREGHAGVGGVYNGVTGHSVLVTIVNEESLHNVSGSETGGNLNLEDILDNAASPGTVCVSTGVGGGAISTSD
jgi:hypothetical protein